MEGVRTLGEELLSRLASTPKTVRLWPPKPVSDVCHVTGGGLAGNPQRVIPHGLIAEVDRGTWTPGRRYSPDCLGAAGSGRTEMEKTFNMGVGMIAVVASRKTRRAPCPDRAAPGLLGIGNRLQS